MGIIRGNNLNKFNNKAIQYSLYRPSYPNELIDFLVDTLHLQKDSTVVDIGCGTGIFTRQLLDHNIKTIGIEPNIEMYNQAKKYLQGYKCQLFNSMAEDTKLDSNIADLVTVAQALHWFDLKRFICEYKRILKTTGQVAIIYNVMDKENEAVFNYLNVNRQFCSQCSDLNKEINTSKVYTEMFGENGFITETYENNKVLSYDEYIGFTESLSYSLDFDDENYPEYIELLNEIFAVFSEAGKIEFPTTTTLVLSKKI